MEKRLNWEPSEQDFGVLWKFIQDDNVTDIDYTNGTLWITDLIKGRYHIAEHGITEGFITTFTHQICNRANKAFNKSRPVLEAQTDDLRITIVHEDRALSGRCICIRKSKREVRLNAKEMIASGYCSQEVLDLIANCVKAKMNIAFCGEPGVGKTECAKFFSRYIAKNERVITIENTPEFHFGEINPGSDFVELIVDEDPDEKNAFDYTTAIKTCLRLNPKWIMLSEARSTEVKYLIEQWSTGVNGFTTLHLDDLSKLATRILNMYGSNKDADRLENTVYESINLGILIRKKVVEKKTIRYIEQIGFYYREGNENKFKLIVDEGKLISHDLPDEIIKKFRFADIKKENIFNQG